MTTQPRIYLSVPHMGDSEFRYVQEAFESNWLSSVGPNLDAFESEFSKRIQGHPCVALSSGTAAIHLALKLLGIGSGDEVLCPSLTFAASCNPVIYQGGRVTFLDSEPESWNLSPVLLAEFLDKRAQQGKLPKALIVVHLYGQSADMDPIVAACAKYEIPILEDAAEAVGTLYKGRQVGTFSQVAAFSFNGNKIMTTTGGGMLASPNTPWVAKARFWSQQSRDPGVAYEHSELGFNYRLSNVLAGIGRGQLEVLDARIEARRRVAFAYRDAFSDLEGISLMPQASFGFHTNWLSVFTIDEKLLNTSRDALIEMLARHNIESRPVWKPMHLQPFYASSEMVGGAVSEACFRNGICLPSSSSLSQSNQSRIIDLIRNHIKQRK